MEINVLWREFEPVDGIEFHSQTLRMVGDGGSLIKRIRSNKDAWYQGVQLGQYIFFGQYYDEIEVWDSQSMHKIKTIGEPTTNRDNRAIWQPIVRSISFHGNYVVLTSGNNPMIRIIDPNSFEIHWDIPQTEYATTYFVEKDNLYLIHSSFAPLYHEYQGTTHQVQSGYDRIIISRYSLSEKRKIDEKIFDINSESVVCAKIEKENMYVTTRGGSLLVFSIPGLEIVDHISIIHRKAVENQGAEIVRKSFKLQPDLINQLDQIKRGINKPYSTFILSELFSTESTLTSEVDKTLASGMPVIFSDSMINGALWISDIEIEESKLVLNNTYIYDMSSRKLSKGVSSKTPTSCQYSNNIEEIAFQYPYIAYFMPDESAYLNNLETGEARKIIGSWEERKEEGDAELYHIAISDSYIVYLIRARFDYRVFVYSLKSQELVYQQNHKLVDYMDSYIGDINVDGDNLEIYLTDPDIIMTIDLLTGVTSEHYSAHRRYTGLSRYKCYDGISVELVDENIVFTLPSTIDLVQYPYFKKRFLALLEKDAWVPLNLDLYVQYGMDTIYEKEVIDIQNRVKIIIEEYGE